MLHPQTQKDRDTHITKSVLIIHGMWCVRVCPHGWQTLTYSLESFWIYVGYQCSFVYACHLQPQILDSMKRCSLTLHWIDFLQHLTLFFFLNLPHALVCICLCDCAHVYTHLSHPSLVQSFVGSLWIGQSRADLMSSMASCSMCIASPMWSCWWAMLMCTVTCCPSTMMTTTTRPYPLPALYSGCSCRGKVSTEKVFEQRVLVSTCLSGQICFSVKMDTKVLF